MREQLEQQLSEFVRLRQQAADELDHATKFPSPGSSHQDYRARLRREVESYGERIKGLRRQLAQADPGADQREEVRDFVARKVTEVLGHVYEGRPVHLTVNGDVVATIPGRVLCPRCGWLAGLACSAGRREEYECPRCHFGFYMPASEDGADLRTDPVVKKDTHEGKEGSGPAAGPHGEDPAAAAVEGLKDTALAPYGPKVRHAEELYEALTVVVRGFDGALYKTSPWEWYHEQGGRDRLKAVLARCEIAGETV